MQRGLVPGRPFKIKLYGHFKQIKGENTDTLPNMTAWFSQHFKEDMRP